MEYNKKTKTLTIPYYFDEELKNIPEETEIIIFNQNYNKNEYSKFNQLVDNLPKNITHLTFGCYFNESINKLPKKLTHLKFGWNFENNIIIPQTVKELSLTCNNNLINNIPNFIEKLYIYFYYDKSYNKKVENLPFTLKEIIIEDEEHKEYIKIPFGTMLTIQKIE